MVAVRASAQASGTALDDTQLAQRARDGDPEAFGLLFERWFDRAFDVAWHIVRNRDTAAEVTQDTFVAAWQQIAGLRQPESFGGWLLRIARNRALNRLQRDRRTDPIGDEATMEALAPRSPSLTDPLIDQERDDLVWVASTALGPDDASLLSLHLRHGLDAAELADELGVQPNAVHQRLFRLRQRLADAIGAWVLWHRGEPACPQLRISLQDAGRTSFSRPTVTAIAAHVRAGCADCDTNRRLQLSPEALFAAMPIVVGGPLLRARAAAALEAIGVPIVPAPEGPTGVGPSGAGWSSPWRWAGMAAASVVAVVASVVVLADRAGDPASDSAADTGRTTPEEATADQSSASGPSSSEPGSVTTAAPVSATTASDPTSPTTTQPPDGVTTTTATDPAEPTPSPVIGGFRVRRGVGTCPVVDETPVVFVWSTTDATAATLGPTAAPFVQTVPVSGSHETCSVSGTEWRLDVAGPGGTATRTATVP